MQYIGAQDVATFPYPYEGNPEDLLADIDEIPIDDSVPFASEFRRLIEEGTAWAPQTTPQSKLATRLHFAGWTRQQLIEFGLNPKNVENFKRNKGLAGQAGRPPSRSRSGRDMSKLVGSVWDIPNAHAINTATSAPQAMLVDAVKYKETVQDTLNKALKSKHELETSIRKLQDNLELAENIIQLIQHKISEGHTEE